MKTYIWKKRPGYYVRVATEINAEYWSGKIGSTYEDFMDGKWILLSDEQEAFHEEHPDASVKEVLDMQLAAGPDPIKDAKIAKLLQLYQYDNGPEINDFIVNDTMHAWFTPEMRSNYRNSIDAAKLLGVNTLKVFIGETLVTISTSDAEQMLAAIQLYADLCFIKTRQHEAAIEALNNIEDINNYDYTYDYPEKLNFTL